MSGSGSRTRSADRLAMRRRGDTTIAVRRAPRDWPARFAPDSTGNERTPPAAARAIRCRCAATARSPSRRRPRLAARGTRPRADAAQLRVDRGGRVVLFLGLRYLGPVLTPFLIGAILAYLGTPLVDWARGARRARAASPRRSSCCCSASCSSRCSSCWSRSCRPRCAGRASACPDARRAGWRTHLRRGSSEQFGVTHRARPRVAQRRSSPTTSTSARELSLSSCSSGLKTGGADRGRDPRQPRADPGGDVLPAARLGHDRRAHRTTLVPRRWLPKARAIAATSTACSPSSCAASSW